MVDVEVVSVSVVLEDDAPCWSGGLSGSIGKRSVGALDEPGAPHEEKALGGGSRGNVGALDVPGAPCEEVARC